MRTHSSINKTIIRQYSCLCLDKSAVYYFLSPTRLAACVLAYSRLTAEDRDQLRNAVLDYEYVSTFIYRYLMPCVRVFALPSALLVYRISADDA